LEIYDESEVERYDNIEYLGRIGKIKSGGRLIGACHEPYLIDKIMESNRGAPCDAVFYGHTHKPWEEMKNGVKIINPGTSGGVFAKATFAVYNTDTNAAELKILELL